MLEQVFVNSLISGSIYALVALGFVLTYVTSKFLNFGHGGVVVLSGYVFYLAFVSFGLVPALILGCLSGIIFNFILYNFFYKRLLERKASKVILLLVSFAFLMAVESIVQIIFSASPKRLPLPIQEGLSILGAKITPIQITIIILTFLILLISWLLIKKTKIGLGLRAVSENKELAEIYGLDSEKIILSSFLIAGFLGAIAGIIICAEYVLIPSMGTTYMIKGFVGAVTGGLTSVYGSVFGSYILGLFENYGAWFLSSSYKDAIAFVLLFLMLLIKPKGLFGIEKGVRE